jgi:hypothetical protein
LNHGAGRIAGLRARPVTFRHSQRIGS